MISLENKSALPCPKCGSDKLMVYHSFGAQVSCGKCKFKGPFIAGTDYLKEEEYAVYLWNKEIKQGENERLRDFIAEQRKSSGRVSDE